MTLLLEHRVIACAGSCLEATATVRRVLVGLLRHLGLNAEEIPARTESSPQLEEWRTLTQSSSVEAVEFELNHELAIELSHLLLSIRAHSPVPLLIAHVSLHAGMIDALRRSMVRLSVLGIVRPGLQIGPLEGIGPSERRSVDRDHVAAGRPRDHLAATDFIIEDDSNVPFRLEMMLLGHLSSTGLIPDYRRLFVPSIPRPKAPPPLGLPPLEGQEYLVALDDFAERATGHNVVVVQGGNRFASHYLRSVHHLDVVDVKLSALNKQRAGILFNSMLTPSERMLRIGDESYRVSDRVNVLESPPWPFSGVGDDDNVGGDFWSLHRVMARPSDLSPLEQEVGALLHESYVRRHLAKNGRPIAFLDEALYRGRILYTTWYLLRLLRLLDRPWRHYVVCADRASQHLRSPFVEVLRPGYGYAFENCSSSEQGYYELVGDRFEHRDLSQLRNAVNALWPDVGMLKHIDREWDSTLGRATDLIVAKSSIYRGIATEMVAIYAHREVFNCHEPGTLTALSDQRAVELGWCPPYLSFCEAFISQERPVRERVHFKEVVQSVWERILRADHSPAFAELIALYREYYPRIWLGNSILA